MDLFPETSQSDDLFQKQFKATLKSKIFLGNYTEKRYVESLKTYRDLVVLSDAEEDLRTALNALTEAITKRYDQKREAIWFGYTNSDLMLCRSKGQCLYTELSGLPFGHYWFQVKSIHFRNINNMVLEIWVKVEAIRSLAKSDYQEAKKPTSLTEELMEKIPTKAATWDELWKQWRTDVNNAVLWILSVQLNGTNILHFLKLLLLLMASLAVAALESVKYIGSFTLRFMSESQKLIRALTPLLMGVLELFSKMVGGLYILIAMIWRDSVGLPTSGNRQQPQILAPPRRDTGFKN